MLGYMHVSTSPRRRVDALYPHTSRREPWSECSSSLRTFHTDGRTNLTPHSKVVVGVEARWVERRDVRGLDNCESPEEHWRRHGRDTWGELRQMRLVYTYLGSM
jgi:hypothetical protein